jgi:hypothetical protein
MNYNIPELKPPMTYKVRDNYTVNNDVIKDNRKSNLPYYVSPLEIRDKTMIPNTREHKDLLSTLSTTGLNKVYTISGKEDTRENRSLLPVYLPDKLNSDNTRQMKLYQIDFGHTKLNIPNTIITIDAAIQNGLYISGDQKERMLKVLHYVLHNKNIFNRLSNEQLTIITQAIELLDLPETPELSDLPRFITYNFYDEFMGTVNIYLLNTITNKPLALLKKDGMHVPLYLTDISPLLEKGYEIDLGADNYTELDNQIQIHREIELGLDEFDPKEVLELRKELDEILD